MKKSVYTILLIFTIGIQILISQSCKDTGVTPKEIETSRRDYVWTVDTLSKQYPWNMYQSIWGNSPNNVFCTGTGDPPENLLHFNGHKWEADKNNIGLYKPTSILGFSAGDFWIGADNRICNVSNDCLIKDYWMFPFEGYLSTNFNRFWANSNTDIYAVGTSIVYDTDSVVHASHIVHFDGNQWNYILNPSLDVNFNFYDIRKGIKDSTKYLILGTKMGYLSYTVNLLEFDGKNVRLLSTDEIGPESHTFFFETEGKLYVSKGKILYRYKDDKLIFYKNFDDPLIRYLKIFGRKENDFFMQNVDGIGHYNGKDIETVFNLNHNFILRDGLIFEKEVFFLCVSSEVGYIIVHGKLKE